MDPLLRLARDGSAAAQEELIQMFSAELADYVRNRMFRSLKRHTSSADVCQDVFFRVFRTLHSLPADASLDLFKGRLLRNAQWVLAQKNKQLGDLLGESAAGSSAAAPADAAPAQSMGLVTRLDEVRWLRSFAATLPAKYSQVISMRLDGLSFREVAVRLDEAEDTVRKRYQRAFRKLREQVQGRDQAEER